jgi:anti-sigma B factor antagonist
MALTLSVNRAADSVTIAASGEIDLITATGLEHEIAAQVVSDVDTVVVDLSGITFVDSAGINTLLKGRRSADEHGKAYRVGGAQGLVREVLEMSGVWHHLSGSVR